MKHEDHTVRDKISPLAPLGETGKLGAGFKERVLALVAEIPEGWVATYGQVARLAGRPRAARQVGGVLRGLSESETEAVPWQRVISAQGELSTYKVGTGELQRALLEAEGVAFDRQGRCDLTRYLYLFPQDFLTR